MRALVVGNGDDFDPGFVGHRLRQHGYAFTELHREHPESWPDLDGVELVLTLGSEWNVYRPETAALVAAEAALVREVLRAGRPLFAICFGAQVLSHALGGTVARVPVAEIGWFELDVEEGGDDRRGDSGPWMEWHDDVFTVPEGFTEVARTALGPQLLFGHRVVATQFHPEATETMIARWIGSGGAAQLRALGRDPDELLAETRRQVVSSAGRAADLVDRFLHAANCP